MKIKSYAPGGKVQGQSHAQGGVPAVDPSGQQIAEIEGNERIFSVEDTQEIEEMALAINELPAQESDRAAMQLGYRIATMVGEQDTAQAQQEVDDATGAQQQASAQAQAQAAQPPQENFEQVDPALAGLT